LVQRGTCTFQEKVRNCQRAGAKGAVVFDNADSGELPMMTDDGSDVLVSIPSVIIKKAYGVALKSFINDDSQLDVEIEIEWELPRPDGRVE